MALASNSFIVVVVVPVSTTMRMSLLICSWSQMNFTKINGSQPAIRLPSILKLYYIILQRGLNLSGLNTSDKLLTKGNRLKMDQLGSISRRGLNFISFYTCNAYNKRVKCFCLFEL